MHDAVDGERPRRVRELDALAQGLDEHAARARLPAAMGGENETVLVVLVLPPPPPILCPHLWPVLSRSMLMVPVRGSMAAACVATRMSRIASATSASSTSCRGSSSGGSGRQAVAEEEEIQVAAATAPPPRSRC